MQADRPGTKNAPVELQPDEGEVTYERQQIMTDVTAGPLRPIYGPHDPRWAELQKWIAENCDERPVTIDELLPTERAGWHESRVLGVDSREAAKRSLHNVDYPEPPETSRPAWATERLTDSLTVEERPLVEWSAELASATSVDFTVSLGRDDIFDPDLGIVLEGITEARFTLAGNMLDTTGIDEPVVTSPQQLRDIAATILAAADQWEATP